MIQLIYASIPTQGLTLNLRQAIAARSRVDNARLNVTGVLLISESAILQVLEGDEDVVRKLYQRITTDHRHNDCELLLCRNIISRTFAQWSMGYCEADNDYEIKMAIVALKARRRMREITGETQPQRAAVHA